MGFLPPKERSAAATFLTLSRTHHIKFTLRSLSPIKTAKTISRRVVNSQTLLFGFPHPTPAASPLKCTNPNHPDSRSLTHQRRMQLMSYLLIQNASAGKRAHQELLTLKREGEGAGNWRCLPAENFPRVPSLRRTRKHPPLPAPVAASVLTLWVPGTGGHPGVSSRFRF